MTRTERLLTRLVDELPTRMTAVGYGRDTCILHTRVAVDTLRTLGVRARPLVVRVLIGNAIWADDGRRLGHIPNDTAQWSEGAWCLGVGYGLDPRAERPGYDGHLIVVVNERYGVDLTLDQANRPEQDIELSPHWWRVGDAAFLRGERSEVFSVPDGSIVIYDAIPEDRGFLTKPDWTLPRMFPSNLNPTGKLVKALRAA